MQKKTDAEWETRYQFETPSHKWNLDNIYPICMLTETSLIKVNKMYSLLRVTRKKRISLMLGNTLIIVKGREKTKEKLEDHEIPEAVSALFPFRNMKRYNLKGNKHLP